MAEKRRNRKVYAVTWTPSSLKPTTEWKASITTAVIRAYKLSRRTNRAVTVSRGEKVLAFVHGQ